MRPGPRPAKNLRTRPGARRTAVRVARLGEEVARIINVLESAITPVFSTESVLVFICFTGHPLSQAALIEPRRPAHSKKATRHRVAARGCSDSAKRHESTKPAVRA